MECRRRGSGWPAFPPSSYAQLGGTALPSRLLVRPGTVLAKSREISVSCFSSLESTFCFLSLCMMGCKFYKPQPGNPDVYVSISHTQPHLREVWAPGTGQHTLWGLSPSALRKPPILQMCRQAREVRGPVQSHKVATCHSWDLSPSF